MGKMNGNELWKIANRFLLPGDTLDPPNPCPTVLWVEVKGNGRFINLDIDGFTRRVGGKIEYIPWSFPADVAKCLGQLMLAMGPWASRLTGDDLWKIAQRVSRPGETLDTYSPVAEWVTIQRDNYSITLCASGFARLVDGINDYTPWLFPADVAQCIGQLMMVMKSEE